MLHHSDLFFLHDKKSCEHLRHGACAGRLHMRCEKCNALISLDIQLSRRVANMLLKNSGVALNTEKTGLQGCCKKCLERAKQSHML